MKLTTTAFVFLLLSFASFGQYKHCYTTEVYNRLVQQHPEALQGQAQLEQFIKQYTASQQEKRTASQIYIIPLVFHIIHDYGVEDISDAQVLDEVRILNLDYRKLDYDTGDVVPAYKSIAADCGIEFRLANIDPNGNCTNGIDRIASKLTYNADDNSKLNQWPPQKYLNIWVVNSLADVGAAAYAYLPGTITEWPQIDGVIVIHSYVGSIGTGNIETSRAVTHEIGHCLNLYHPWGATNAPGVACGDDSVSDTPITEGWGYCDLSGNDCDGTVDNVQNYMEYSYCSNMFTNGQKARMLATLNSPVLGRNNLWTTVNETETGISSSTANLCAPKADFIENNSFICSGGEVQFNYLLWNGQPSSWSWSFPGGNPSTSTDSMPVVSYSSTGTHNVTLTLGNASGSGSITKNAVVYVSGTADNSAPYYQSFETSSSFPGTDGFIINPDSGITWTRSTRAGSSGSASIMIKNFNGSPYGQEDSYITPSFDISHITQPTLTFKVANAQGSSTTTDTLKVYISVNCGATWVQRYIKFGAALATGGVSTLNFVPTSTQWRTETINLTPFSGNSNLRIKFVNGSAAGNNTYIDEVNVAGTVGVDEINPADFSFEVYPNPSKEQSIVSFELQKESSVQMQVLDITGREVNQITNARLGSGTHNFNFNSAAFSKGIYFIELLVDDNRAVKKLIVE